MLRALSKLPRSRLQRALSSARAAQQQGGNVAVQQQQPQGQMQRNVPRNMVTSPLSLTRDLAPLLPRSIASVFRDMERMLEDPSTLMTPQERQALAPFVNNPTLGAVDVKETNQAYEFDVDIPGLTKDEVQVMVNRDGILTIKGERKFEEGDDNKSGYRRVERAFGEFVRRFQLPDNTDPEHIQAKVENGVLKVTVPKSEEHGPAVSQIKVE